MKTKNSDGMLNQINIPTEKKKLLAMSLSMKRAVRSLIFCVIVHLSHLENLFCRLIDSCGIRRRDSSIPKAKSVNQSYPTSDVCVFLYAGLVTYFALQVNVTEDNRILRDVFLFN